MLTHNVIQGTLLDVDVVAALCVFGATRYTEADDAVDDGALATAATLEAWLLLPGMVPRLSTVMMLVPSTKPATSFMVGTRQKRALQIPRAMANENLATYLWKIADGTGQPGDPD